MTWQIFISAFSLGLLSSFHCVGMCGAIAFSLPTQNLSPSKKLIGIVSYNSGRIFTYSIIGVLFGVLGRQINIFGFQQWFSIIAGSIILMIVIQTWRGTPVFHLPGFGRLNKWVQNRVYKLIQYTSFRGVFLLGMANGLLPCGLIYLAVTGAMAAGTIDGAAGFMIAFGLGTFPALFLVSWFSYFVKVSVRSLVKKTVPYFVGVMGLLLILRGMGLNIPFISPLVANQNQTVSACH